MAKSRRKSRKRQSRATSATSSPAVTAERPLLIERLADAALILGLFSVLAFSEIRFEGFETEKAALMPILGGIILGSHLSRFFRHRDMAWKQYLMNPVVIGVIGIIITSTISSLLGFSPARSWFGEAERLSGLQTLLMYILLFSQAVVATDRVTPLLTPIIITIAAPLCASVFYGVSANLHRASLGSTTGNPNYLSSWLVMSMLMLIFLLFIKLRKSMGESHWVLLPLLLFAPLLIPIPIICWTVYQKVKDLKTGWKIQDWVYLLMVLFMLVFMTATIVVVGSRAALLSYAVGGMTAVCIILAVARQRRLLMMFSGIVILAGISYVTVSNLIPVELIRQGGIYRVFNLGDSRRQELWGGAISVIKQQDKPFYLADGTPDSLASIRPIVGYGLSVISQTQGRFGATTHQNQFVGSYHNHLFDYIVMTGYPGMLFYIVFYMGAVAMALRQLRLLRGDMFQWAMVILMFSLIGVLVTPSLFPGAPFLNIIPIGLSLGALAGNFVWIAGQAFRKSDYEKPKNEEPESNEAAPVFQITDRQIVLAGLLGIFLLRWLDIQFGFVQAASEPMFWILAGLFLGHFYKLKFPVQSEETDAEYDVIPDARPIDWQMGVMGTGIMLLYGFGYTVQSRVYNHNIGLIRIPVFLTLLTIVGYIGVFFGNRKQYKLSLILAAITPVILGAMWAWKNMISMGAGTSFDNAIATDILSSPELISTFVQLSSVGVVMVILMLIVWTFYDNWRVRVKYPIGVGVAIVLGVIGATFYASNYVSATTHKLGIGFMEEAVNTREQKHFQIADAAFEIATSIDLTNARMRVHYLGMMTQQNTIVPNSRPEFTDEIDENTDVLLQYEPYFIHTLEWQQFSGFHERVYGRPFRKVTHLATDY